MMEIIHASDDQVSWKSNNRDELDESQRGHAERARRESAPREHAGRERRENAQRKRAGRWSCDVRVSCLAMFAKDFASFIVQYGNLFNQHSLFYRSRCNYV